MTERRKGINLKKGRVPSTLYWGVLGNKVVGRLDIRQKPSKLLSATGGYIGYAVVPRERRKGYGTEMLRLGLRKAKKFYNKKIIITCLETNIGSRKIIENNGGIFINKMKNEEGETMLRFWIHL